MFDIKIFENGEECETIRGLTYHQCHTIKTILTRHNMKFLVIDTDIQDNRTGLNLC